MNRFVLRAAALGLCASVTSVTALAQVSRYATSVVSYNPGPNATLTDTALILGGPRGGDGIDVLTLGIGGDVTLGFDRVITDGPGADFVVFENSFEFNMQTFAEMAMVEVSTNGVDFARFPMRYNGPQGPFASAFELLDYGVYSGLTGAIPPLANVVSNTLDPFNPVEGGGEAFDLADLSDHALVFSNLVDLNQINYVRLVDLEGGTVLDSRLIPIWDAGGAMGDADIDSVAILNDTTSVLPTAPVIDFWRDEIGYVYLQLSDPDGFTNIDLANVQFSANLVGVPFYRLREFFVPFSADLNGVTLRSPLPMFMYDIKQVFAIQVVDFDGNTSVDQISMGR